jgi:acetyl-CoA acetyltransferase
LEGATGVTDVSIHDAVRTARGRARPDGGLAQETPQSLVAQLVDALELRGRVPRDARLLILGSVGQIGAQGGHIALIAKLKAGLAPETAAHSLNNFCASGLSAIGHAAAAGTATHALAGLGHDEAARTTAAGKLAALPAAFAGLADAYRSVIGPVVIDHRHTPAHAPPMTNGAGLALVGPAHGNPRARITAFAEAGGENRASLLAGFAAMETALYRAGFGLSDMDRIEFMEAFADIIARLVRDYRQDIGRVNVGGGHIAKGHPLGATGAILLSTLLDALDGCGGRDGLEVATGAQGVGAAMVVERL